MGKILKLSGVRRSNIRCPETGVVFPQLYRLSGFKYQLKEGVALIDGMINSSDDIEPSNEASAPYYTLDANMPPRDVAYPKLTVIHHLDSQIDTGWIIVRHHQSWAAMDAYIDAVQDLQRHDEPGEYWYSYDTDLGCFTVVHRPATVGAPDCLLVYQTKVADNFAGGTMNWTKVVDSSGEVHDEDYLYPPEVQEEYRPLQEFFEKLF